MLKLEAVTVICRWSEDDGMAMYKWSHGGANWTIHIILQLESGCPLAGSSPTSST